MTVLRQHSRLIDYFKLYFKYLTIICVILVQMYGCYNIKRKNYSNLYYYFFFIALLTIVDVHLYCHNQTDVVFETEPNENNSKQYFIINGYTVIRFTSREQSVSRCSLYSCRMIDICLRTLF